MFSPDQYELIDFGEGQKLELFAGVCVQRESPIANGRKSNPAAWKDAFRFQKRENDEGVWIGSAGPPRPWIITHDSCSFRLKPTPFGQIGVFPEQAANWSWIDSLPFDLSGLKAINLFAYTGGTTMSLATRGASVAHVDSAMNIVNWARANAEMAGLKNAPIRWLAEDALTFVRREIKRQNYYDIIVADPPSFGRGPRRETWKLQRDVDEFLASLAALSRHRCRAILFSCHTPEFNPQRLGAAIGKHFEIARGESASLNLYLTCRDGRRLQSGSCFRWFAAHDKATGSIKNGYD